MNMDFLQRLMTETGFPREAQDAYNQAAQRLSPQSMDGAIEYYYENDFSTQLVSPLIEEMARQSEVSVYTVWGLFLAFAAERAHEDYLSAGISEEVFFATFSDLRYKALECKANKGVWGNFVAFWYPIFYSCDIVKLGRLEYETRAYVGEARLDVAGVSVVPGQKLLSIHIPSSGEPFDAPARIESYKLAYDFFKELRSDGPLVCMCSSWLLYPEYKKMLPESSNIVGFMGDFNLVSSQEGGFDDGWRVFGPAADGPVDSLPEGTSMQRAFKKHLQAGGKTGSGFGILVFDGEKLLH